MAEAYGLEFLLAFDFFDEVERTLQERGISTTVVSVSES
jgi:hypothetical protein